MFKVRKNILKASLRFLWRPSVIRNLFRGRELPMDMVERNVFGDKRWHRECVVVSQFLPVMMSGIWRWRPPPIKTLGCDAAETPLVVSVTTMASRIDTVHLTLYSLMSQSRTPDKVFLWLKPDVRRVPDALTPLRDKGLEIKTTEDIGSYAKLVPALRQCPESVIVTADDDVIYPYTWLERLERAYIAAPSHIHCHISRRIELKSADEFRAYADWPMINFNPDSTDDSQTGLHLLPIGYGGVAYPPGALHEDATDATLFRKLCPHADDIWFKAMSLRNGTVVHQVAAMPLPLYCYTNRDGSSLAFYNLLHGGNDVQWRRVCREYDLMEALRGHL